MEDTAIDTAVFTSAVIGLIVCALGIAGNVLAIVVLLVSRDCLKSTSCWWLFQLAIANTLFLISVPFGASEKLNNAWLYSTATCKAKESVLFLNYYASTIFLTILSVDRYVSVRRGFARPRAATRRYISYGITATIWIVSLALCVPIILYSGTFSRGLKGKCGCGYHFPDPEKLTGKDFCLHHNYSSPDELDECLTWAPHTGMNELACTENKELVDETVDNATTFAGSGDYFFSEYAFEDLFEELSGDSNDDALSVGCHYLNHGLPFRIFVYAIFAVMFLVPFLIIAFSYIGIVVQLRSQRDAVSKPIGQLTIPGVSSTAAAVETLHQTTIKPGRENRVTWMCVLYFGTFVCCWLPFHASHMAKMVGIRTHPESNFCRNLSLGTSILCYVHAAANPYLYLFAMGAKKIKRTLFRGSVIRATAVLTKTIISNSSSANQKISENDHKRPRGNNYHQENCEGRSGAMSTTV